MKSNLRSDIRFFYESKVNLRDRSELKRFIETLFKSEKRSLKSLNYIFCSDKRLLSINNQYLQHNFYTDIISFGLSGQGEPTEAEIYISIDRVKENASDHKETFTRELHRVIFHGALHLCGYRDKTKREKSIMRVKEDSYLNKYFRV
ncbi:MAG: rRNA maturation RNase YbeY [Chitinophagaceae bacterium]